MLNPPPLPVPPPPPPPPDRHHFPVIVGALGLTVLEDYLLWSSSFGGAAVCGTIFAMAVAITGLARQRTRRLYVCFAFTLATAAQAATDLKPSTIGLAIVLLLAMIGEGHFSDLPGLLARWLEAVPAVLFPFPALRRLRALYPTPLAGEDGKDPRLEKAWRVVQAIAPALALAALFAGFFAQGNAVFARLVGNAFTRWAAWLFDFDYSIGHLTFWALVFTLLLSVLRPQTLGLGAWIAGRSLPPWPRKDEALGLWQSVTVLAVLNALFCYVNTIDVVYLWSSTALPTGVNPSEFLHEGVQSLIIAVLLSAAVLVLLFQQRLARGSRVLQWLATVWVLQNLLVIAGVYLRLKFYVDDLQLTLLRIGVGLFLVVVVAGFLLLTAYFWRSQNFSWLVTANLLATFAVFFVVQFLDLNGAVARYNVHRWLAGHPRYPDVVYLGTLGHNAWPAMIELAQSKRAHSSTKVREQLAAAAERPEADRSDQDWRRWELRRSRHARELSRYLESSSER